MLNMFYIRGILCNLHIQITYKSNQSSLNREVKAAKRLKGSPAIKNTSRYNTSRTVKDVGRFASAQIGDLVRFSKQDIKWVYPNDEAMFGTLNNRLSKELEITELLTGAVSTAEIMPGKNVTKKDAEKKGIERIGGRQRLRSITAENLGNEIQRLLDDGSFKNLLDKKKSPDQLFKERGYPPTEWETKAFIDGVPAEKKEGKTAREVFKTRFIEEVNNLRNGKLYKDDKGVDVQGDNAKAGASTNFIIGTCQPTAPCKTCYAAKAMWRWSAVTKAFRDTVHILVDPKNWAEHTAKEINSISKADQPIARMLGSGDLTWDEQVTGFNHLAKLIDRPIHVFSRHHENLAKLKSQPKAPFIRMGSIDTQLYEYYNKKHGKKFLRENLKARGIVNAWLHVSPKDYKAMDDLFKNDAMGLILSSSVKLHNKLVKHNKSMSRGSCPCDADERTFVGSCIRCAFSEAGCFMPLTELGYDSKGKVWNLQDKNLPSDINFFTQFPYQS